MISRLGLEWLRGVSVSPFAVRTRICQIFIRLGGLWLWLWNSDVVNTGKGIEEVGEL